MSFRGEEFLKANRATYTQSDGIDTANFNTADLQKLWLETLNGGTHGICFSMYEDGQE